MLSQPRVAIVYGPLRVEERLLFAELERRGIAYDALDDRQLVFNLDDAAERNWPYDVVIARGVAQQRTFHTVTVLEALGIPVVNPPGVLEVCNDKLRTSAALRLAQVPQPALRVAFSPESA